MIRQGLSILGFWTLIVVGLFVAAWVAGCGPKAAPAAPSSVDEMSWCYAAVVGGVETVGCAEAEAACNAARAATYEAATEGDSVSEGCYQVRLRLDRTNP